MLENLPDPTTAVPTAPALPDPSPIPGTGGTGSALPNKTLWIAGAIILGACVFFYTKGKKNDPKV